MLTIIPLSVENQAYLNRPDARFLAGERVQLRFTRKGFLPEYVPLSVAEWRTSPSFPVAAERLIGDPDHHCCFAVLDGRCVGQFIARKGSHALCELLDIRTDSRHRRQGIATAMLNAVVEWASAQQLAGIRAETTDDCPGACQFFERCGFVLGGVDMLWHARDPEQQSKVPAMRESVLTFYQFF